MTLNSYKSLSHRGVLVLYLKRVLNKSQTPCDQVYRLMLGHDCLGKFTFPALSMPIIPTSRSLFGKTRLGKHLAGLITQGQLEQVGAKTGLVLIVPTLTYRKIDQVYHRGVASRDSGPWMCDDPTIEVVNLDHIGKSPRCYDRIRLVARTCEPSTRDIPQVVFSHVRLHWISPGAQRSLTDLSRPLPGRTPLY